MVEDTLATINIYKTCQISRERLAGNQIFHYHNPTQNFAHRLQSTLDDFQSIFNSDKSRYSYNLGKF